MTGLSSPVLLFHPVRVLKSSADPSVTFLSIFLISSILLELNNFSCIKNFHLLSDTKGNIVKKMNKINELVLNYIDLSKDETMIACSDF